MPPLDIPTQPYIAPPQPYIAAPGVPDWLLHPMPKRPSLAPFSGDPATFASWWV